MSTSKANGNQFWRNVKFPGRKPLYATPEDLFNKFIEYMKDNETKSWNRSDFIKSGPNAGQIVHIEVPNPPSLMGFSIFAGFTTSTFNDYGRKSAEFLEVTNMIRELVITVQVEGATTNTFNANIVARLAGLVDKKELDVKSDMSDDEKSELIKKLMEKMKKE